MRAGLGEGRFRDWDQRLAESMNSFKDCSWPLMYLRHGTGGE